MTGPLDDQTLSPAQRLTLALSPRIRALQAVGGKPVTGAFDENTGQLMVDTLRHALEDYNAAHGQNVTTADGEKYWVGPTGKIHALTNGHRAPRPEGDVFDVTHPPHAATLAMLQAGIVGELDRLRDKRLQDIQAAQQKMAASLASATGSTPQNVLDALHTATDYKDARVRLGQALGEKNPGALDFYTVYLWNLTLQGRTAPGSHYFPEESRDPKKPGDSAKDPALVAFAAVNDILTGLATGVPGNVLYGVHEPTGKERQALPRPSNSLFADSSLAAELNARVHPAPVTGSRIGGGFEKNDDQGKPLLYSRNDVSRIALERFEKRALNEGIALHDITRAMVEGRFNIPFEELKLVYNALGDIDTHAAEWNRRYGAIADIGPVTTLMTSGLHNDPNFKIHRVQTDGRGLIIRRLEHDSLPVTEDAIRNFNRSIIDYFYDSDLGAGTHDLRRDYEMLEKEVYYKNLQLAAAGRYAADPAAVLRDAAQHQAPVSPVTQSEAPAAPAAETQNPEEKLQQIQDCGGDICRVTFENEPGSTGPAPAAAPFNRP